MPGRIDAAIACWLVLGRALVARLAGARDQTMRSVTAKLARKVTSTIGIAEFVPLRSVGKKAPCRSASGFLSLRSLAQADGWMLVPAESEGYPAGYAVDGEAAAVSRLIRTPKPP